MFKEQYPGDDDSSNDGQQDQQIPVKSETSSTGTMKRVNGGSGHVGGTGGVTPRGRLPSVSAFSEFDFDDSEHSGNASSKEEQSLFTSQTRRSKWSKWLFIAILVVAAAAVSIGVYFFTENQEENDFEHAVSFLVCIFLDRCVPAGKKKLPVGKARFFDNLLSPPS